MVNNLPSINLVKKEKKPFIDTFLHWALTIGRLVVMLTEIIALSTFLYRFTLDRQLVDLHDKIKQKQTILNLLQTDEKKYRNLQNRLALASQFDSVGSKPSSIFMDIFNLSPVGFDINTITISENNVRINGNARSLSTLNLFINNIKSYPQALNVSLDKIENRVSNATLGVSLSVALKK